LGDRLPIQRQMQQLEPNLTAGEEKLADLEQQLARLGD
jgi:hypothetical protein